MKTKTLLIEIRLDKNITKSDLDLRRFLVDNIVSREMGEVVEETSSSEKMEVVIEALWDEKIEADLQELLISLGFNDCNIQDISRDEG